MVRSARSLLRRRREWPVDGSVLDDDFSRKDWILTEGAAEWQGRKMRLRRVHKSAQTPRSMIGHPALSERT
jgi:hypothetical protein